MKNKSLKISLVVLALAAFALVTPASVTTAFKTNNAFAAGAATPAPVGVSPIVPVSSEITQIQNENTELAGGTPAATTPAPTTPGSATTPSASQPAPTNPYECGATTIATCIPYFIFYLIQAIGGLLVSLGAFFVQQSLQFNSTIFNSPMIQAGFAVALSIANLGFVLGIIIIAIATILRQDNYGIKQILWKLVVMAILINFGLVIAAPIVGFANTLTTYFLQGAAGGNATSLTSNGFTGASNGFTTALVGLFAPGKILAGSASSSAAAATGPTGINSFLSGLLSLFFSIAICGVMALALFALAALLFVRYVQLGILLILLPFAWLAWVFPNYHGKFDKWWSDFIKWTFFPVVALFFIYLAMLTLQNAAFLNQNQISQTAISDPSNPASTFLVATNQTNNTNGNGSSGSFLQQGMDDLLLCMIMIGGLFAASAMTGEAGKFVVGQAKSVSNAVQGYATKQTKKAGRLAYQKADKGVAKVDKKLGRFGGGGIGITQGLRQSRIPFLSRAGRAIGSVDTNSALVENAKKGVPKSPDEIRSNLRGRMNKESQFAHISKLIEAGELKGDEVVEGKNITEFLDSNTDLLKRYGQGKLAGDASKAIGNDKAMRDAERGVREAGTDAAKVAEATKKLDEATKAFVEKLGKGDIDKMNVNGVLGKDSPLSRALMKQFARTAPELVSKALPKLKAGNLEKFNATYEDVVTKEIAAEGNPATKAKLEKVLANYRKSFIKNMIGSDDSESDAHEPKAEPKPTGAQAHGAAAPKPAASSSAPKPAASKPAGPAPAADHSHH